jgi:phenylalanyl-tRNA synthetase beta chain
VEAHKLGGEVGYLEIDWDALRQAMRPRQYQPTSRYPSVRRDLAVVIDRVVTWDMVRQALADYQAEFVNDYYGEGMAPETKSMAIRLTLQAPDRTLTDADADRLADEALSVLKRRFDAQLRS